MKQVALFCLLFSLIAAGCDPDSSQEVQSFQKTVTAPVQQQPLPSSTSRSVKLATTSSSASNCDPNYTGCVPIASDVDCAGGSGNGPAYVQGPIQVIDRDIYGLDRDGDGVACQ